jgi:putative aldouronate transport system permease protein
MVEDRSVLSRGFDIANGLFLGVLSTAAFLPLLYVIMHSFSAVPGTLIPTEWTASAYSFIFSTSRFPRAMMVSFYITGLGTAISLTLTSLMAYGMSYG